MIKELFKRKQPISREFTENFLKELKEVKLGKKDAIEILDAIGKKMGIVVHCEDVGDAIFRSMATPSKYFRH